MKPSRFHVFAAMSVRDGFLVARTLATLAVASCMVACGGGGSGTVSPNSGAGPDTSLLSPAPAPTARVLAKPVLSFTDTGLSVTDGITQIGAWQVGSLEAWEYSFDMGNTWIRGLGDSFDVLGDGAKTIWVRARDDLGNTSEIVIVSCVLDTMPPPAVQAELVSQDLTRLVRVNGLEQQGRWEYSVDDQRTWLQGTGDRLAVLGNSLPVLWLRQVDLAGNKSPLERVNLLEPGSSTRHEASGQPLLPSLLS